MVPEGWDILPLGEMADFRNGLNFTKSEDGDPIKIITIPDFWQRSELRDLSGVKSISPKGKVPPSSLLESGDMLFVRSNGNPELVGRCLFFPEINEPVSFSGFTIRGRVDQEQLFPEFAAYVMLTERTKAQFRRGRGGGNISNLSQDILAGVQVALPPLPEQRKIADILSTWDRAIETTEALLATARTQKRALMQSLLTGKRRFPGFEGQQWKEVRLGDLCEIRRGASPRPIKDPKWFANTGRGWVRISDVTACSTTRLLETEQYLSELGVTKSVPVEPGELIMSICATIGVPRIVGIPVCIHDGFVVFRKTEGRISREFLYYFIELVTERLKNSGQPGTQKNLNTTIVGNIIVPDISMEEQVRIAGVLGEADEDIAIQSNQIEKLRTEKKALMQQLLTGKRRVVA